jgi:hypothetical protein
MWWTSGMLDRDFKMGRDQWAAWFSARGSADLSLLLFAIWDPIGVSDSAITAGEYDSYLPEVLSYVRDDDAAGLADYLRGVAVDAMGLSQPELPMDAARRVINGAYASAWRWAGRPLPGDASPD